MPDTAQTDTPRSFADELFGTVRDATRALYPQARIPDEPVPTDPRDARPEGTYRHPIFRDHNCWKCRDGEKPCPSNYSGCEYPRARNG